MDTSIYLTNPKLTGDLLVSVGDEVVALNSSKRGIHFDIEEDTEITVEYVCERRTFSYECKKLRNPLSRLFWLLFGGIAGMIIGAFNFLYDDKMKEKRIFQLLKTVNPYDIKEKFTLHGGEEIKLTVTKQKLDTSVPSFVPSGIVVDGASIDESEMRYNSKYYKNEILPPFVFFFAVIFFLISSCLRVSLKICIKDIMKFESFGNVLSIIVSLGISIAFLALVVYTARVMKCYWDIAKKVNENSKKEDTI